MVSYLNPKDKAIKKLENISSIFEKYLSKHHLQSSKNVTKIFGKYLLLNSFLLFYWGWLGSVVFMLSLRPYGSKEFEISSCCQHRFFNLLRWVRPWLVFMRWTRICARKSWWRTWISFLHFVKRRFVHYRRYRWRKRW